jgi:class 3 adenylate cyclase
MECRGCGQENRVEARFCEACGGPLGARRCSSCDAELRAEAKFCDSCGQAASAPSGVRDPSGATPRPTAALPTSFASGRYVVDQFLGEGGRKRVYSARDQRLDRDVALALVKTEGLDADGHARIQREAQAMGRLGDHPNIVTIYDVGEESGQPYIVSHYMSGGSVEELLRNAPEHRLAIDEAIRISAEICQALDHAHCRDVVHRDLKPANVWLAPDGAAQLGDFGLAIALDRTRLSLEGTMVGTVAYMPPEQATGGAIDARSDLYSLGAMLYEMVTGRPPFVGDEPVAVISQHLNIPPVSPSWHNPNVPPSLEVLILQLLAKAPEERPRSAAAVLERLSHIDATTPTASPATAPPTPSTGLASLAWGCFVGRDHELSTLKRAVENALGGQGSLVMVAGEPGIGKTRLAEEVGVYARLRGAQVLIGRCYEDDGAPPFWPWMQVIRAYAHEREPDRLMSELGPGASDIAQLVSDVRVQLPGLPPPPTVEPDQARFRLFDSITTFLKQAAHNQPLVVILDDLQWADKASLLLLKFLSRELVSSRIVVIATYRDVQLQRHHPLAETLAELGRERPYERIFLSGLSPAAIVEFLEAMAQHELDDAGHALAKVLHRDTEGNPFFIEEILRRLAETGRIFREDGRWVAKVGSVAELGVAEGVRELIGSRLRQLSPHCNQVLVTASVLGREFDLDVLGAVVEVNEDELLDAVDEAVGAGLLGKLRSGGGQHAYSFSHNLVREALYDELSTLRRVRLHRRVGEAIESMYASSLEPHLPQLAYHFLEGSAAGDPTKALEYAVRAGERATKLLAYEEAVGQFQAALVALERMPGADPHRRCDLLLSLGDASWRAGELTSGRETLQEAARLARTLGDPDRLARAALCHGAGVGGFGFIARANPETIELLEEALSALGDDDSALRARLMARLATELYYTEYDERRAELSRAAVEMAERLGDPSVRLVALYSHEAAVLGPDAPLVERVADSCRIVELATELGDKEMAYRGHVFCRAAHLENGDAQSARREDAECVRLAEELRMPLYLWLSAVHGAMWALHEGRFGEGETLAQAALAAGQDAEPEAAFAAFGGQAIAYHWGQGRFAELLDATRMFADQFPWIPSYRCALAFMYAELDRIEEAHVELKAVAANGITDFPRDGNYLMGLFLASLVSARVGDAEISAVLYDLLRPHADRGVIVALGIAYAGSINVALGALAASLSRWDDADAYFRAASEHNRAAGLRGWGALGQREHMRMLLRRDRPEDRQQALTLANELLEESRELAMPAMVDTALAVKLELQGLTSVDVSASLYAVASAVEVEQPDLAPHAAPDGTVTILFSDIEGSTAMAERLGDDRWLEVLRAHNDVVRAQVQANGGIEVKSIGDGFMMAFGSARRALRCAVGVQRTLATMGASSAGDAISVRIGLHTGEVIAEANDFFGKNVILASRIAAKATGGEILVSSVSRAVVQGTDEFSFGDERPLELKGLAGTHVVHALEWREDG